MPMRKIACVLLLSSAWMAQNAGAGTGEAQSTAVSSSPAAVQQPSVRGSDELSQMRDDLNRMDSLNANMSSEIEFLHDQNLQILLRTNAQMWAILVRDLRRRIEQEEVRQGTPPQHLENGTPAAQPKAR